MYKKVKILLEAEGQRGTMNGKNLLSVLFLIAIAVFAAGCASYISSFTMRFSINETGEPLEGEVFNNGNPLGYAQNGSLSTDPGKLRPGLIALKGTYHDQPFEFYFEFSDSNLDYGAIDFSVKTSDLEKVLFNTSGLNIQELERTVFDLVNKERRTSGIKTLRWNDGIARIAKDYSRTLSIEGFHHKDIEGKDAGDRLKENKIFYIVAAENLYMREKDLLCGDGIRRTGAQPEHKVEPWLSDVCIFI